MAEKCLETLFMFSLRLGGVITKNHLAIPIQRFFLAFDKSFNQDVIENIKDEISQKTISEHFTRYINYLYYYYIFRLMLF